MAFLKALSKKVAEFKDERAEIKEAYKESFEEEKKKVKAERREAKIESAKVKGRTKAHKTSPGPQVSPETKAKAKKAIKTVGAKLGKAIDKAGAASDRAAKGDHKVPDLYPKRTEKPASLDEICKLRDKR